MHLKQKDSLLNKLKQIFLKYINSGIDFSDDQLDLKVRHNNINITILLAYSGLIFGIVLNFFKADYTGIFVDISAILILFVTSFSLRNFQKYFELTATILATEFLILFSILLLISDPSDLRHIWLLTYPALIFFFKGSKSWITWIGFLILTLFLVKLQPFYPILYSFRDILYISVVLIIMTVVISFYKSRIDQGNETIFKQKNELEKFAKELENKVQEKTQELQQLNANLEQKVREKAKELVKKDAMILAQSRQAAMGEMISMIAHQWRQPLSTITLQISNLKINSMIGKSSIDTTNDALEHISETIIYLSETIDDFQTFFRPNKEKEEIGLCELLERGTNFAQPRLKVANIILNYSCSEEINLTTHTNELAQVIINIINNSIDALLENHIEKPLIQIESHIGEKCIEIHISDNAGGINHKIIKSIFEPYFSTKGKNGTGLGLYMSKMIIENKLNGNLRVRNHKGGAEFIIEIPR